MDDYSRTVHMRPLRYKSEVPGCLQSIQGCGVRSRGVNGRASVCEHDGYLRAAVPHEVLTGDDGPIQVSDSGASYCVIPS